jgi:hypothetical protein
MADAGRLRPISLASKAEATLLRPGCSCGRQYVKCLIEQSLVDWWRSKEPVSDGFAEISGHIFGPWSRFAVQRPLAEAPSDGFLLTRV